MPQLGAYQVILLASRGAGIIRDGLILTLIGATALSDAFFFLVGFVDLLMAFIAGSGSVVFLSRYLINADNSELRTKGFSSAVTLYVCVAFMILVMEIGFGAPVGQMLFVGLGYEQGLLVSYHISLIALVFTLPIVAPNAVFLFRERMYLQPLVNIIFTFSLLTMIVVVAITNVLSTNDLALAILLAAVVRLGFALYFSNQLMSVSNIRAPFAIGVPFYKNLLSSGFGAGALILLPFIFRARLPLYGDGMYASVAFLFKFNDLFQALFVIPGIALVLRDRKKATWRRNMVLLSTVFIFATSILAIAILLKGWAFELLPAVPINFMVIDVYNFVFGTFVFSSLSYCVSMIAIDAGHGNKLVLASLAGVISMLGFQYLAPVSDLQQYFLQLYFSFAIFLSAMLFLVGLQGQR